MNHDGIPSFAMARAARLDGPWTKEPNDYATAARLHFADEMEPWTEIVSHGEVLDESFVSLEKTEDRVVFNAAYPRPAYALKNPASFESWSRHTVSPALVKEKKLVQGLDALTAQPVAPWTSSSIKNHQRISTRTLSNRQCFAAGEKISEIVMKERIRRFGITPAFRDSPFRTIRKTHD